MVSDKTELAAGASYTASFGGVAIGNWIADHWLQLFSAVFILATYFTQLYFSRRRDRRETDRHLREMLKKED